MDTYEKKYKGALARCKWLLSNGMISKIAATDMFRELIDDDSENVGKKIIHIFHSLAEGKIPVDINYADIFTWLEKQDKSDKIVEKAKTEKQRVLVTESDGSANIDWDTRSLKDARRLLECGLQYINTELEKQGKQKLVEKYNITGIGSKNAQGKLGEMIKNLKSADKVEPKFHEGEWIIRSAEGFKHNTYLVKEVKDYYACEDLKGQRVTFTLNDVHKNFKLWDIAKDAKDGDVLAVEPENGYHSPFIAIYKERGLDFFNSHCFISFDAKFYTGDTGHDMTGIHPATKEQCDLLFKKMKEAGYEWDAEKKELKKIKNKNLLLSDFFKAEYERGKTDAQKSAEWSEDDEVKINRIVACLENLNVADNDILLKDVDWLKSIKDRVQPKIEWSEGDERMYQSIIDDTVQENQLDIKQIDWLKSLRFQKQWKPSEKQMETLEYYMHTLLATEHKEVLFGLYNDLKQL